MKFFECHYTRSLFKWIISRSFLLYNLWKGWFMKGLFIIKFIEISLKFSLESWLEQFQWFFFRNLWVSSGDLRVKFPRTFCECDNILLKIGRIFVQLFKLNGIFPTPIIFQPNRSNFTLFEWHIMNKKASSEFWLEAVESLFHSKLSESSSD